MNENGFDNHSRSDGIPASIPDWPITGARPVPKNLDDVIKNPGAPRANQIATKEDPNGRDTGVPNRTVLQQHVDYWDFDKDGIIWPWDTYRGFHEIGFPAYMSFIAIFVIHGTFSYPTLPTWIPDPRFPIHTKNMHRTKHGSDSEVYDTEGRFVPQKFEELFTKYDEENKGGLTLQELWRMTEAMRNVLDPTGWTAAKLEWGATYYLLRQYDAQGRGMITKQQIKGIYDGSIFFTLAKQNRAKKAAKAKALAEKREAMKNEVRAGNWDAIAQRFKSAWTALTAYCKDGWSSLRSPVHSVSEQIHHGKKVQ
jgi:peroxygenase